MVVAELPGPAFEVDPVGLVESGQRKFSLGGFEEGGDEAVLKLIPGGVGVEGVWDESVFVEVGEKEEVAGLFAGCSQVFHNDTAD